MMTIKEMSELTGVSARALRYYDEIGLFHPNGRSEAGYRLYDEKEIGKYSEYYFTPFIWMLLYQRKIFYLYCGKDKPINNFNKSTAIVKPVSFLSLYLGLKEGKWYLVNTNKTKIVNVDINGTIVGKESNFGVISAILSAISSIGAMVTNKQIIWSVIIIWIGALFWNT